MKSLEINPKVGFGDLKFGDTIEHIHKMLGPAEEVDNFEEDEDMNTVILHYWNLGFSVFFEGNEKSVASCFETDNAQVELYGQKLFSLSKEKVLELMKKHGFSVYESEPEEGEVRYSFDEAMIDFYFRNDALIAVSWSVLINEAGEVELLS